MESAKASVKALISEKREQEKLLNERQQVITQKDRQISKLQGTLFISCIISTWWINPTLDLVKFACNSNNFIHSNLVF